MSALTKSDESYSTVLDPVLEEGITAKPKAKSMVITNVIYKEVLVKLEITDRQSQERYREDIGRQYIRDVRRLNSSDLELILQEYEDGLVNRDDSTIQEILDELASRILIGDGDDENVQNHT